MIYTTNTKKAMKLAYQAHEGQLDKSGLPYILHPLHLAEQMTDEKTTIAALLHDVVEDTEYTFSDLRKMGFDEEIIAALELLTHDDYVDYMEYVTKLKSNPIARAVKLADLTHNSDLTRLDEIKPKDMERFENYKKAISLIEYN